MTPGPFIEIVPDTLYIEENFSVNYIHLVNPSFVDYDVDTITENGYWWDFYDLPLFPHTIVPNDTLTLSILVSITGYGGSGMGYDYDTVFVVGAADTNTSIVAFNLEVIPGIKETHVNILDVFPNPGTQFTFRMLNNDEGTIDIFDDTGNKIEMLKISSTAPVLWSGKNDSGQAIGAGVYYYLFYSESRLIQSGKLVLIH